MATQTRCNSMMAQMTSAITNTRMSTCVCVCVYGVRAHAPVNRVIVAPPHDILRRYITRRAAEGVCAPTQLKILGKSKVAQLGKTLQSNSQTDRQNDAIQYKIGHIDLTCLFLCVCVWLCDL